MRNNEYDGGINLGSGYGQSPQPTVIAPVFATAAPAPAYAPAVAPYMSPYAAPIAPAVAPVVGGFGGGGFLESIIALSLIGKNGVIGGDCSIGDNGVAAQNVSNLRKEIGDVGKEVHVLGNEVQKAFAMQTATQLGEFRNLDNQICSVEKEAIKAQYEAKISSLQSTNEITNKIDASTVDLKNQLFGISTTMASEFCDTKHLIERGNAALSLQMERSFCELTENHLRDQIAALRDERDCHRRDRRAIDDSIILSQQTNSILNAIDSQLQRQTSQIVQFGAGNLATPVNTNTQTSVN